jgi:CDP-6-deoxy-D-xylo-4-hexulose-3-dehydrase
MTDKKSLEKTLTAEILERVRQLARLRTEAEAEFVPGRSPIRYAGRVYGEEEMTNLVESALEFWLTAGRWHRKLETDLAEWYGVSHARLVNSGSSANLLAVATLTSHLLGPRRLQQGDEIITVAAGFPTTVAPMIQLGLVPVFVDVSIPTYNIDVGQLEAARSSRTRAVMVAHTLGNPFDLGAVSEFCKKHGLWLVEDNCDAAGSRYRGRKTGTFGDLATLSFYPPHHMTTGEGGAVLTSDDTLEKALTSLRDWGRDCWCASGIDNTCKRRFEWQLGALPRGYDHKYIYSHLGYNLKMTDLQASVGVAQLARLDGFIEARRANFAYYQEAFRDLEEVLVQPSATPGAEPSWFGYLMTVREGAPFTRDDLVRHLESRKIQTRMLFAGNLVRQPAMTQLVQDARAAGRPAPFRVVGDLERTDTVMNRSFWIGVYPGYSPAMRDAVVDAMRSFVKASR